MARLQRNRPVSAGIFPPPAYRGSHMGCEKIYLAELGGRTVGTLVLQWSDEETWSELPNDTGYVHGLAIRRGFAGRGLGRELLRWAEDRTALSG
jgi:GNAT superfamily N-acetyltransferase